MGRANLVANSQAELRSQSEQSMLIPCLVFVSRILRLIKLVSAALISFQRKTVAWGILATTVNAAVPPEPPGGVVRLEQVVEIQLMDFADNSNRSDRGDKANDYTKSGTATVS